MIADVETILSIAGIRRYLQIGCSESNLVFELLKNSMDAYGIDASSEHIEAYSNQAPDRFFCGSLTNFPLQQTSFGAVIIGQELLKFPKEQLHAVFNALYQLTESNLILYFPTEPPAEINHRVFFESLAFLSGFRTHLRSQLKKPYPQLEDERIDRFIFLEKIPLTATQIYSADWLKRNAHLEDNLRASGRKAEAAVARYVLAANQIRRGDVVLDAACGLGYGTAILAATSSGSKFIGIDHNENCIHYATANYAEQPNLHYLKADITHLTTLPDHSVDVVIAFDIIEKLPLYDLFFTEVKRVLKPDGRFIGSVSHSISSQSQTQHAIDQFHYFNWSKIAKIINHYFVLDARWIQIAGKGVHLCQGNRTLNPLHLDIDLSTANADWWVFSSCVNPLNSTQPYVNAFSSKNTNLPDLVNFEKYYDNPWLYRVMVQLGERLADTNTLLHFCSKVIEQSQQGSADLGAALCVVGYQLLESGTIQYKDVMTFINTVNLFDQAYDRENPHAYRWAISLHYVAARILLAVGKRQEALATFITCAEMDSLKFSPLLATKTISSRMFAALLCLSVDNIEEAKTQLRLGIKESHRVVQGNWKSILGDLNDPLPFGLQETAEVLDIASQCAQVLGELEKEGHHPGYMWDKVNLKRFGLATWNKSVEKENHQLRQQIASARAVAFA